MSVVIYTDPGTAAYELIGLTDNGRQIIGESVPAPGKARNVAECVVEAPTIVEGSTAAKTRVYETPAALVVREHHHKHHHKHRLRPHRPAQRNSSSSISYQAPLANFSTATFTSCGATSSGGAEDQQIAGGSAGGLNVLRADMYSGDVVRARTGAASGDGSTWSVNWQSY
jgi:hypothetical protein